MADVYDITGKKVGTIKLPPQFTETYRPDIIKRSVMSFMSKIREIYGSDKLAGFRSSAKYKGNRHAFGTQANRGMHRTQRIRRGSGHMSWKARISPGNVKGRKAHPPLTERIFAQKINKKENRLAIRSAISATSVKELIENRGHKISSISSFPLIVDESFKELKRTKDMEKALISLGLKEELERVKEKKIRAGKGTMRNRKYKKKVGPLIVFNDETNLAKVARNISGVDVVQVKDLNTKLLAPGNEGGRLTIWTKSAIETMDKEKLYI